LCDCEGQGLNLCEDEIKIHMKFFEATPNKASPADIYRSSRFSLLIGLSNDYLFSLKNKVSEILLLIF